VNPGTNITYVITVTNSGPTAAIDVVLEDFIPIGERTLSVTPDSGNCLAGVAGDPNRPTTCNFGTVDPNETVTVTVVVEADNCLQDLNKLFNDVRVSSATFDPDNSDNVFHSSTEVRQTSNGNVKAVVSKGQLKVTGDNFNNTIRFDTPVEAGPDAIRITPFGGTRINGQCRSVQLHGVKGGVSVRMGRANDSVFFDGPITMKQLSVIVGLGNDTVALSGVTVNAGTTIRADGGDDVVSIIDSVLNAGPAQAGLGGVKQKSALTLRTGIGDDTVTIEGTQVVGSALIRNDGNDDFVRIVDSIFEAALKLEGGRDFDRIEMSVGNTFANTPSIKSFEEID
jgi:uncharacterized repeat protein (TIGR01451 family)